MRRRTVTVGAALVFAINLLLVIAPSTSSAPPAAAAASCAATADSPVIPAASWGQRRMGAEGAWPRTTGSVTVAVIDTGVSARTDSLRGAVLAGSDLSGGRGDTDCFGRGTFIASLIAARPIEGTEFIGVAPGASILPIRVTDDPDDFALKKKLPGLLAAAINTSVKAGARVIVTPLTTTVDDGALRRAVSAAVDNDVLIVASAAHPDGDPVFPAQLEGVLSVAPLTPEGGIDPTRLGAVPDLASPATELTGAVPDGPGHISGGDYSTAVGYAAAAAALVIEAYPQLSAPEVRQRLIDTADGSTAASPDGEPDPSLGYGVINPVAAVTRLATKTVAEPAPEVTALALPPVPDERPIDLALVVGLGAVVLAAAVMGPTAGVIASRRGRISE